MPRLTEQEQQESVRYIEADKPLPDKFRFLLFEDKREVELVWNGKTSEVCILSCRFKSSSRWTNRAPKRTRSGKIRRDCYSTWTPAAVSSRGGPTNSSGATTN